MKLSPDFLRRVWRFGLSGVFVTGVHMLVALGFIQYVLDAPSLANGVAFAVATCVSYLINTLWSFSAPLHGRTLRRFLCVSILGCVLAMGVSGLANGLGWSAFVGVVAVAVVIPPLTFFMHNFWTYRTSASSVSAERTSLSR